jgi:hypothetical protein
LKRNELARWLDRIRLKGKYPLYAAQKHVIAAITKGFERATASCWWVKWGLGRPLKAAQRQSPSPPARSRRFRMTSARIR